MQAEHTQANIAPAALFMWAETVPARQPASNLVQGRMLPAMRAFWVAITALSIGLFLYLVPIYNQDVRISDDVKTGIALLGFTGDDVANFYTLLNVIRVIGFAAVGALIFRARSNDWMAVFVSLFLITFPVGRMLLVLPQFSEWGWPAAAVKFVALFSLIAFFYVFPDGRFVPRWTRWLALLTGIYLLLTVTFPHSALNFAEWDKTSYLLLQFAAIGSGVYAQVYRYMRVSGALERQQARWVVFAGAASLAWSVISALTLDPSLQSGGSDVRAAIFELGGAVVTTLVLLLFPAAVGIAVMQYRLWRIDVIINRTLVYVPLTGILAGLYAAAVTFLQKLSVVVTGQQSDMVAVFTALILAAVFTPVKNRLQELVDRRFKGPDHTQKLEALGKELESSPYLISPHQALRRLLAEAVQACGAQSGAVYLAQNGDLRLLQSQGEWHEEDAQIGVELQADGERIGMLQLGARHGGREYDSRLAHALLRTGERVAGAIKRGEENLAGYAASRS